MSKAKTTTEVLKAAKWMLENIGWIQGQYEEQASNGKFVGFCSDGAMMRVEVSEAVEVDIKHDAWMLLQKQMNDAIVYFNDDPKRTKQEVLDAFDRAIQDSKKRKS